MECCYPIDCEEYSVTPVLMAPCCPTKCCDEPAICYPCLPRCPKAAKMYCCEKKRPKTPPRTPCCEDECCMRQEVAPPRHRPRSPPPTRQPSSTSPHCCQSYCHPTCKPVKTKYVIPCYRYEDGRINQPTVLMRRACEVACGARQRRKPFVLSTYAADATKEERQYHSEDERGNCCFHFERKKPCHHCPRPCHPCGPSRPSQPCTNSPQCQYVDCVMARPVDNTSCCYYC